MKDFFDLMRAFFIIGGTTFGGGYAMIPVLERELIKKRGWISMDEVIEYFTIAQITPGIIMVNVATFVGYKRKGFFGGILSTISLVLPGVFLMVFLSVFIKNFAEYEIVKHAFAGIRLAVSALILDAVIKLFRGIFKTCRAILVFIIAFVLSAIFSVSPVFIILGAGVAGFFLFSAKGPSKQGEGGQKEGGP
jgi:chromate transporter